MTDEPPKSDISANDEPTECGFPWTQENKRRNLKLAQHVMSVFNVDATDPECLLSAFDVDEARRQITVKLPKWCHALLESF